MRFFYDMQECEDYLIYQGWIINRVLLHCKNKFPKYYYHAYHQQLGNFETSDIDKLKSLIFSSFTQTLFKYETY